MYKVNFSLEHTYWNLFIPYMEYVLKYLPDDIQHTVPELILDYQKGTTTAYLPVGSIDALCTALTEKVISDPNWALRTNKKNEEENDLYFKRAKEIAQLSFETLSTETLVDLYGELHILQRDAHLSAIATTWFLDVDQAVYSAHLESDLRQHLQGSNITDQELIANIFIILTTPDRSNMIIDEERSLLAIVEKIVNNPSLREQCTALSCEIHVLPPHIQTAIADHLNTWGWIPYGYTGPTYTQQDILERIRDVLLSEIDPGAERQHLAMKYAEIGREIETNIRQYDIPDSLAQLFHIARNIIWLKDYRKLCLYHGLSVLNNIVAELAKRSHLTLRQAATLLDDEMLAGFVEDKFDVDSANDRERHSIIIGTTKGKKILAGNAADEYLQKMNVAKVEINPDEGFQGSCACPGRVTGTVKVINQPNQMEKMNEGDIMIAHTTFPSLVPAMKKASAIVTEDGGITCHAAIVARELRKPCVVGARHILEFVKDGDTVEVDATGGIVKIL